MFTVTEERVGLWVKMKACVATKDIVIMKAFEEPLVSNGPDSGRVKQHPLQSTASQEYVRGGHFG